VDPQKTLRENGKTGDPPFWFSDFYHSVCTSRGGSHDCCVISRVGECSMSLFLPNKIKHSAFSGFCVWGLRTKRKIYYLYLIYIYG